MSEYQDTYAAFMFDHASGNRSAALALAGDLHILLSETGANTDEVWQLVASEFARRGPCALRQASMEKAYELTADGFERVRWRRGLSGAHCAKIENSDARLMRLMPGKSVPKHGHKNLEVTVVLQGAFTDGSRIYRQGDIAFGLPGHRHKPAAHGDQPCICFVATTR